MHPEECPPSADEGVPRGHRDVPDLDQANDVVLVALEGELQPACIGLEGCPRGIVHPEAQLCPYGGLYRGLYLLIEVKEGVSACSFAERRIIGMGRLETSGELGTTLESETNTSLAKEPLCHTLLQP